MLDIQCNKESKQESNKATYTIQKNEQRMERVCRRVKMKTVRSAEVVFGQCSHVIRMPVP